MMKSSLSLSLLTVCCGVPVATGSFVLPSSSISRPAPISAKKAREGRGRRLSATLGDWGDVNSNGDFQGSNQFNLNNNADNGNNQNAWIQDNNSYGGEEINNQNNLFDSAKELFNNNNVNPNSWNNNPGQQQDQNSFVAGIQDTTMMNADPSNEWGSGGSYQQQQQNNRWGRQQEESWSANNNNFLGSLFKDSGIANNLNNNMNSIGGPNEILANIMTTPTPGTDSVPVVVPVLLAPAALLVLPVQLNVVLGILLAVAVVLQACAEESGDGLPNQIMDFFSQPTPGISDFMYLPITYPMVLILGGIFLPNPTNFAYLGIFAAFSVFCSNLFGKNERSSDIPSNLTALVATVLSTGLVGNFLLNPKEMAMLVGKTNNVAPIVLALPLILAGVTAILSGLDNMPNLPNFAAGGSREDPSPFRQPRNKESNPWGASMNYNQDSSIRDGGSRWGGSSPNQQQQQQGYNNMQQQQGYSFEQQQQQQQGYNPQQQQQQYNPQQQQQGYNGQQQAWGNDNNNAMFQRPPQENFDSARSSLNNDRFQPSDRSMGRGVSPEQEWGSSRSNNINRGPSYRQPKEQVLTANEGFLGSRQ